MTDDNESTPEAERWLRPVVLAVLGVVVLGGALDLYLDGPQNWRSVHVLVEATLMAVSASVGVLLWRAWQRTERALVTVERSLTAVERDRQAWQARAEQALSGLAQAIDDQFDAWSLTPSEREVAMMLLKGYGHKQIAFRTERSESTIRQHAVAVYGKSGQAGRAELAAFFLDGLMLPSGPDSSPGREPDTDG